MKFKLSLISFLLIAQVGFADCSMIARTDGTVGGGWTLDTAAFDGNTNQVYTSSARTTSDFYLSKDWARALRIQSARFICMVQMTMVMTTAPEQVLQ